MRIAGLTRDEVGRRVGSLAQVAGVEQLVEADGPARGARRLRLVTGGGLELDVLPDRALDLGALTVHGVQLAWLAPAGFSAPGLYRADDFGTSFGGGLLVTCGLDHVGSPVVDGGRRFPQHGRLTSLPASLERAAVVGDELVVEGVVRQAALHEEHLVLRRRIRAGLGSTWVTVEDTVTNEGWRPEPHLVLYHANLGWPLVSEAAALDVSSERVEPDGPDAVGDPWREVSAPEPGYRQRVHRHDLAPGTGRAVVSNPALGLRLTLTFPTATLPVLYQWKMFAPGQNVLGLEPANAPAIQGRAAAREAGTLPVLAPGESVSYSLRFDVDRIQAEGRSPTAPPYRT
ncbi:aldose 1-epimerase family protein [Promicromonospora sp. NPDC059942]|uniref:aldose 1-epimerase family protein n=1 Tax=Promicromonospora sp. NPDC059942 TaxID=3347009 RepID=UPI003662D9EF